MKKQLRLEIRPNLRRSPRVYVKSVDLKTTYGSFHMDETNTFDGWEQLSIEQTIELKQFMQNVSAVYKYLKPEHSTNLADFRFRLPLDFMGTLEELEIICHQEGVNIDIFESIITSIIHQMRIATSQLTDAPKMKALALLDKAKIADFKKQTHCDQIKSVFSEVQTVYNRSEKLHKKAITLFNKDKSYSPLAIKGMATGESIPSKWLVACAIDLLIDENNYVLSTLLTANDFYLLWAKPLNESNYKEIDLLSRAERLEVEGLIEKIKNA